MTDTLQLRKTHKYVGSYKHLDEHEDIGTYTQQSEIARTSPIFLDDMTDPRTVTKFVSVVSSHLNDVIRQALEDTFSSRGCAHEHDCCGCRSYSATASKVSAHLWCVVVSSSRNY